MLHEQRNIYPDRLALNFPIDRDIAITQINVFAYNKGGELL